MFPTAPKLPTMEDIADAHRVPVRIGGGGLPFSPVGSPWLDPRQEALYPPGVHGRKRPDPRSGGFDVSKSDADMTAPRTESSAGWPNSPDEALDVPGPDFGRRLNTEQTELHAQLPFVEFVSFPQLTKTIVAPSINYVAPIHIPDTAQLVRFQSVASGFVGRYRFTLPLANGETVDSYIDPIVIPTSVWLYCYGMKTLYVGIPVSGDAISAMFYMTQ